MILCCRRRLRPEEALIEAFDCLRLERHQQVALKYRYINVVMSFAKRARRLDFLFHFCRFLVTTGSLMVPALLSIQYINNVWWVDPAIFQIQIYWATWTISLLVTMSNGIMTLFKFDKAYYFTHTTYELLKSEGWQYIALTGKYATKDDAKEEATHFNQFRAFYHNAEKIKLRQVEEEYYKFTDLPQTTNQANGKPLLNQQTPSEPQNTLPKQEQKEIDKWSRQLKQGAGSMADTFLYTRGTSLMKQALGISRRVSRPPVDGAPAATATSEIPRIAESSSLPMQPQMQPQTPTGETMVRTTSMREIQENSIVSIMSEQPDERLRATSGDGDMEQQTGIEREP